MTESTWAAWRRHLTGEYARTAGIQAVTTAVLLVLRTRLRTTDVAMLYLVPVVVVASRYRRGAAVLATALSIALFDFLFVPPYYTFDVGEPAYFLTFVVMCVVALVLSHLTATIREQREVAAVGERRAAALYALASDFTHVEGRAGILEVVERHLGRAAGARAVAVLADDAGLAGDDPRWPAAPIFEDPIVRLAAVWTYRSSQPSGRGTTHATEADELIVPLRGSSGCFGIAILSPEPDDRVPAPEEVATTLLLADRAGLELERLRLSERGSRQSAPA